MSGVFFGGSVLEVNCWPFVLSEYFKVFLKNFYTDLIQVICLVVWWILTLFTDEGMILGCPNTLGDYRPLLFLLLFLNFFLMDKDILFKTSKMLLGFGIRIIQSNKKNYIK